MLTQTEQIQYIKQWREARCIVDRNNPELKTAMQVLWLDFLAWMRARNYWDSQQILRSNFTWQFGTSGWNFKDVRKYEKGCDVRAGIALKPL